MHSGVTIGRASAVGGPKFARRCFLKFFGEEGALLEYLHAGPLQPCYATGQRSTRMRLRCIIVEFVGVSVAGRSTDGGSVPSFGQRQDVPTLERRSRRRRPLRQC